MNVMERTSSTIPSMSEPHASQTRGFLFADLRDYTRFVEAHGDQAAAELLTRFRVLVREVIGRFDGAEIRTEGDSFYVVFPSASAAVNGGMAILEAAAAAGGEPGTGSIRVGVGVHAGETAETPEGLVGSAVNLAARICALAGPGELLVSDTVRGLTRTFLPVQFVPHGRRRFKGIAEPVLVYSALPASADGRAMRSGRPTRWRPRGSRVLAGAALAVVLAVVAGAALLGALTGAGPLGQMRASPAQSSLDATAPAPGSSGASADPNPLLTAAQEALLDALPGAVGGNCAPATVAEGSAGGSVSLRCQLPLGAGADEVWVDEFATPETLAGAFADEVARTQAPLGSCEADSLARGSWGVPNVHSGSLLCFQQDGAAWLVWTYDIDRILMRAKREGGNWAGLYEWWDQTAIFLR